MDKNLLEQAMSIAAEGSEKDIPHILCAPTASVATQYKTVYRNIRLFLERDKALQNKLKCLSSALEGLGIFDGKKKKVIKQRVESLKASMSTMHSQLLKWWEEYENCPISIKVSNTPVGECVCFGYYECFKEGYKNVTSKISWKVLAKTSDRALLISDCVLDVVTYSSTLYEPWQTSRLRRWCKDLYAKNFTNAERQYILTVKNRTPDNPSGAVTEDNVFCLSATEVKKYMPTCRDRYTTLTPCASDRHFTAWDCWEDIVPRGYRFDGWWTRTPGNVARCAAGVLDHFTTEYRANSLGIPITESRNIYSEIIKVCPMGIRPALWVRLE